MVLNYSSFLSQIKEFNYFENKAKITVGVSGGVDSISLVFLLSLWAKINKFSLEFYRRFFNKKVLVN